MKNDPYALNHTHNRALRNLFLNLPPNNPPDVFTSFLTNNILSEIYSLGDFLYRKRACLSDQTLEVSKLLTSMINAALDVLTFLNQNVVELSNEKRKRRCSWP